MMRHYIISAILLLSVTGCVPVLVAGAGGTGYYLGQDERPVKVIADDARITSTVKAKILAEKGISAVDINVDTNRGAVVLYGSVPSRAAESKAIQLARETKGVIRVTSKLTIAP